MAIDSRTHLPVGVQSETYYINVPSADLLTDKGMGTQALMGQRFDVMSMSEGYAKGALYSILPNAARIDYIGTVPAAFLSKGAFKPSHKVSVISAAVFEQADIKSRLLEALPRNALMDGELEGDFLSLERGGYVHLRHLGPVGETDERPYTAVAADMLGLPYIWGGTGYIGVDCSGLVQSALAAIGTDAPRDADQQERDLGESIVYDDRCLGDLLFWPGHVGIVVEGDQLLHANAHHMSVAIEPVAQAVDRIGPVRSVKRL